MSDVTERVEAQHRREANERRYRALAEPSAELVSLLDAAGVIRCANPAHVRVFAYTPEEAPRDTAVTNAERRPSLGGVCVERRERDSNPR